MSARPEPQLAGGSVAGGSVAGGRATARSVKLSRDIVVNAALSFLDREGWDALTINALATALHGFVLLEMTGVMDDVDTEAVFSDMVRRLASGLGGRTGLDDRQAATGPSDAL